MEWGRRPSSLCLSTVVQLVVEGRRSVGRKGSAVAIELSRRAQVGGLIVVATLTTVGIMLFGSGSVQAPALPAPAVAPSSGTVDQLTVHVSGAVAEPGLVRLAPGSRVADALAAVGGSSPGADLGSLNLAAPVSDGDHVVVLVRGPSVAPAGGEGADGRISINTAAVDELAELPGVGPVLAQRIADFRDVHGPLVEVEDLLDVPGIGEAKLAAIRDFVAIR